MVVQLAPAVKEEPEDEEEPEALEMPPSVLMDRLQKLLNEGRVRLRFAWKGSEEWGINGKLPEGWISFSVGAEGVCELVEDETVWKTGGSDEWTETELEQLEQLREEASKFPTTSAEQPKALHPRKCRACVFAYHKAEFAKKAKAAGKPAPGKAAGKAAGKGAQGKTKASPPAAAAAKPAVAKAQPAVAKAPLAKAAADSAAAAAPDAAAAGKKVDLQKFMGAVKAFFADTFQRGAYKRFLKKLLAGAEKEVQEMLEGSPELQAQHKQLEQTHAKKLAESKADGAGKKLVATAKAAAAPDADAADESKAPAVWPSVNVEEMLKPARARGGDAAAQLVNHVFCGRGARATLRLAALKLARAQETRGGVSKELVLLRGPPGIGKTAWALSQLSAEVGLADDEELPARFIHVCSSRDFMTKFSASGEEEPAPAEPTAEALAKAQAQNEARVRLAMEAGVQPIYVDDGHARLWEMTAYAQLARKHGYDVVVVAPSEINDDFGDTEALLSSNNASPALSQSRLQGFLDAFEDFPLGESSGSAATALLLATKRPAGQNPGVAALLGPRGASSHKRSAEPAQDGSQRKVAKLGSAEEPEDEDAEAESLAAPQLSASDEAPAASSTEAKVASSLMRSLFKK